MSTRCITPYHKKDELTGQTMALPCSKCPACAKRRISGWSFRLRKQGEISNSAHFVTLTYDTEHVPITKNGYMSLRKSDVQKFMKRLRKIHETDKEKKTIKYYAVGEYGGKTNRPHYHIIIYNANVEYIERAWALENKRIGNIFVGNVQGASIGYTLKYISKEKKIPQHKNDDRVKEFSLMSKGLGLNYLSQKMETWHKADLLNRMYIPIEDGKKIAMPRYYKDKIYNEQQKQLIATEMAFKASIEDQKQMDELGTDYYRIMAERHLMQFQKMYKKSKQNDKL